MSSDEVALQHSIESVPPSDLAQGIRSIDSVRNGAASFVFGDARSGLLLQVGRVYLEEASLSVHAILIRKGATVFTIEPTDSLADAAKSLTNHGIGALVVTDAEGHTIGIISERDIVRALGEKESAAFEAPVAEIMTRKVVFCSRHDKLVDLMQRMTDGKFRHLPVIEDGRLIGIVSIGDVVESRLEELEQESDTLREYIHRRAHHKYD